MSKSNIINLDELEYVKHSHGDNFEAECAPVGNRLNAKKLGYRVTRLPPGKRAWPLHAHYVNEEMFFVLSGRGSVRIGSNTFPISQGDFISAPANPDEPHQIVNTSESVLAYICVSTMLEPEIAIYPESGKLGIIAGSAPGRIDDESGIVKFINEESSVDYWDGES